MHAYDVFLTPRRIVDALKSFSEENDPAIQFQTSSSFKESSSLLLDINLNFKIFKKRLFELRKKYVM